MKKAQNEVKLKQLDDDILKRLKDTEGSLVEDVNLINGKLYNKINDFIIFTFVINNFI